MSTSTRRPASPRSMAVFAALGLSAFAVLMLVAAVVAVAVGVQP